MSLRTCHSLRGLDSKSDLNRLETVFDAANYDYHLLSNVYKISKIEGFPDNARGAVFRVTFQSGFILGNLTICIYGIYFQQGKIVPYLFESILPYYVQLALSKCNANEFVHHMTYLANSPYLKIAESEVSEHAVYYNLDNYVPDNHYEVTFDGKAELLRISSVSPVEPVIEQTKEQISLMEGLKPSGFSFRETHNQPRKFISKKYYVVKDGSGWKFTNASNKEIKKLIEKVVTSSYKAPGDTRIGDIIWSKIDGYMGDVITRVINTNDNCALYQADSFSRTKNGWNKDRFEYEYLNTKFTVKYVRPDGEIIEEEFKPAKGMIDMPENVAPYPFTSLHQANISYDGKKFTITPEEQICLAKIQKFNLITDMVHVLTLNHKLTGDQYVIPVAVIGGRVIHLSETDPLMREVAKQVHIMEKLQNQ